MSVTTMNLETTTLPAGWQRGKVGLLAGSGRFPFAFAEKARKVGLPVVCVGISYEAAPELAQIVDRFYWAGIAKIGRVIRCFRREGVTQVVMAGKVQKTRLYDPFRIFRLLPDWRTHPLLVQTQAARQQG